MHAAGRGTQNGLKRTDLHLQVQILLEVCAQLSHVPLFCFCQEKLLKVLKPMEDRDQGGGRAEMKREWD